MFSRQVTVTAPKHPGINSCKNGALNVVRRPSCSAGHCIGKFIIHQTDRRHQYITHARRGHFAILVAYVNDGNEVNGKFVKNGNSGSLIFQNKMSQL